MPLASNSLAPDSGIHKDLAGICAGISAISAFDAERGSMTYRGYRIEELCQFCSFEAVVYLLWYGELPDAASLAAFRDRERQQRELPDSIQRLIADLPRPSRLMDVARTVISALGLTDPVPDAHDPVAMRTKALSILAKLPVAIAAFQGARHSSKVTPSPTKPFAENVLQMLCPGVHSAATVRCFEVSLILYAEHGFSASSYTARVAASTRTDLYAALTAGASALQGPLHSGANEKVLAMLQEIGPADRVPGWVEAHLMARQKIIGFGHRNYPNGDPRVPPLLAATDSVALERGASPSFATARALMEGLWQRKRLRPNLDFASAAFYGLLGLNPALFTPVFLVARIAGLAAHVMEQIADNTLVHPDYAYCGEPERRLASIAA
jgi:citrate synthase